VREAQGKKGGVVRLAYLTAVVPKVGDNLVATIAGGAPPMEPDEVYSSLSIYFYFLYTIYVDGTNRK
jgi:hypothetical protein